MADQKISELAALTGADLAGADEFAVVDTTAAETKRITFTELQAGLDGSEAGLTFPDYATFIADTNAYTAGTVAVLRDTGFRYEAAASGDVTNAGSQQFEVLSLGGGYNVKAFGAAGDGVADDTAEIQAAISSAKVVGALVYFPAGRYLLSSPLTLTDCVGVSLIGEGVRSQDNTQGATLALAASANCNIVTIDRSALVGDSHIQISRLTFDGNRGSQNYATCKTGDVGHAIFINDMDRIQITGCFFRSVVGSNIKISGGTSNTIEIANNFLFDSARNNLDAASMADGLIHGNQIGFASKYGYDQDGATGSCVVLGADNNIVSNNRIWQAVGSNVTIFGGANNVVTGNIIDGPTRANVYLQNTHGNLVANNRMFDGGVTRDSRDATPPDTTFEASIKIGSNATDNIIKNNFCKADVKSFGSEGYEGVQRYGVHCDGDRNVISGNWCGSNLQHGIMVEGNDNEIADNTCLANAQQGIQVNGARNNIKRNRCSLNDRGIGENGTGNWIDANDYSEPWGTYSSTLAANAGTGDDTIEVASAAGLSVGDAIAFQTDNGIWFSSYINGIDGTTITLRRTIKGAAVVATAGNSVRKARQAYGVYLGSASDANIGNNTGGGNATDEIRVAGTPSQFLSCGSLSEEFTGREVTISSSAITATRSLHQVDTEGNSASDELWTINSSAPVGTLLVLRAADNARTVVVKDGSGNIRLNGDMSLTHTRDTLTLLYIGSDWLEISRSDNET